MSNRWSGKYVIGLTGNIATGKSMVRQMLGHLGAVGIDADALSHQALAKGGPGYTQVVKAFGEWLLGPDGEINRATLGKVVFADPKALAKLEAIVHPVVGQAVDFLIKRAQGKVIVIEAIKLLEAGLSKDCDAVWVVNAPEAMQVLRLINKRKMPEDEAVQRIGAQSSQAEKIKAAQVVITNTGTFEDTWTQVQAAFTKIGLAATPATPTPVATPPAAPAAPVATPAPAPTTAPAATPAKPAASAGERAIKARRGNPKDANAIAALIKTVTNGQKNLSRADIMEAFGDKAYMLVDWGDEIGAAAGWKVENLVARVDEFYILANAPLDKIAPPMLEAIEKAAGDLQSEAALMFVPLAQAQAAAQALAGSGYIPQVPEKLGVAAWKDAAKESMPTGTAMLFKKLREDRVMKPI